MKRNLDFENQSETYKPVVWERNWKKRKNSSSFAFSRPILARIDSILAWIAEEYKVMRQNWAEASHIISDSRTHQTYNSCSPLYYSHVFGFFPTFFICLCLGFSVDFCFILSWTKIFVFPRPKGTRKLMGERDTVLVTFPMLLTLKKCLRIYSSNLHNVLGLRKSLVLITIRIVTNFEPSLSLRIIMKQWLGANCLFILLVHLRLCPSRSKGLQVVIGHLPLRLIQPRRVRPFTPLSWARRVSMGGATSWWPGLGSFAKALYSD